MRAAAFLLAAVLALPALAADEVRIARDLPYVEVKHEGKAVRIERNPDTQNEIEVDFAYTSRPCPPYCVQPMQLAPGVETLGELELLGYLKRQSGGDESILVVDSREPDWLARSGIIPGALHLPWTRLHPAHADAEAIAAILALQFGASRTGLLWNFENARTLVFYCNGPWCGQSPTNIKQLLAVGYPPHKLKWYRGGMQSWKSLGLATAPYKKP